MAEKDKPETGDDVKTPRVDLPDPPVTTIPDNTPPPQSEPVGGEDGPEAEETEQ